MEQQEYMQVMYDSQYSHHRTLAFPSKWGFHFSFQVPEVCCSPEPKLWDFWSD